MASWARAVLAASAALLAVACGTVTPGTVASGTGTTGTGTASATASGATKTATHAASSPAAAPAATVTPAAVPGLADATLLDTSWVSAAEGWALAVQQCARGDCTRVARTTDSGQHWQALPDPPAVPEGDYGCSGRACAAHVTFASPRVGYLYGPALLMTSDGGRHWLPQPGPLTETLAVAGGTAYRIAYDHSGCPGPCQPSLQEAPAGSAHWRTLASQLTEPDRSGTAQFAISGPDLLVALYGSLAGPLPATAVVYRSADGGGTWQRADDPCTSFGPSGPGQEDDLTGLAAAPGGFFAGVCTVRVSLRTFVITSADAGATWQETPATPPGQWNTLVAAAGPATIALASGPSGGNGKYTTTLVLTTDGGRQWVTAATDPQDLGNGADVPAAVSFETPLAGQWLGDAHGIWTTADGGLHWTRAALR